MVWYKRGTEAVVSMSGNFQISFAGATVKIVVRTDSVTSDGDQSPDGLPYVAFKERTSFPTNTNRQIVGPLRAL